MSVHLCFGLVPEIKASTDSIDRKRKLLPVSSSANQLNADDVARPITKSCIDVKFGYCGFKLVINL